MKKIRKDFRPTKKENDALWMKAVKLRAGMKSEFSGKKDSYIAGHHILGKQTLALRYDLRNGVCITTGEHCYIAHNTGRSRKFTEWALQCRGVTEEQLLLTSRNRVDLFAMQLYLEQQIERYEKELEE